MEQKTLAGSSVPVLSKKKVYRKWGRCPHCDVRIYEGRGHNCQKAEVRVLFDDLSEKRGV